MCKACNKLYIRFAANSCFTKDKGSCIATFIS